MEFPSHVVELAMKESGVRDQVWVLITGGDKNKTISYKEMEEISGILGLNLCEEEIKSVLFWGKYGSSKNFKRIQSLWLDLQTGLSSAQEDCEDSKAEPDLEVSFSKESLKDIEISYKDFCDIFERNERSCKRRIAKRIDLRNVK